MRKYIIAIALAIAAAAPAHAEYEKACKAVRYCLQHGDNMGAVGAASPWSIKNYRVTFPGEFRSHWVGERDLTHGDWLTGVGVDLLWLKRVDEEQPIAYLLGKQMFDIDSKWTGAAGASIGINTGKAGETIGRAAGVLAPEHVKRLNWLRTAANWLSIELGGGYRFSGVPDDQSPWYWSVGGKVRIPIEKLWGGGE